MSEFNKDIISDESVRHLLQLYLLEGDEQDVLTQQLIEMETTYALGTEAFNIPAIPGEKLLVNKLKMGLGKSAQIKWIFTGILAISTSAALVIYNNKPPEDRATNQFHPVIANVEEESPAPDNDPVKEFPNTDNTNPQIFDTVNIKSPELIFPSLTPPMIETKDLPLLPSIPSVPYPPLAYADTPRQEGKTTLFSKSIPIEEGHYQFDTILDGIKKLEINGGFCSIQVNTHESTQTNFETQIDLSGKFKRKKGSYKMICNRIGSTLKVYLYAEKNVIYTGINISIHGLLKFEVPSSVEVDLTNSSGNITVSNLRSNSNALNCHYGKIQADNMSGDLSITSNSGPISVNDIHGNLKINARYGNTNISDVNGKTEVISSSGSVKAQRIKGDCVIEARYGSVHLDELKGDIQVVSSSGNVEINDAAGKKCSIISRYGNTTLSRIESNVEVESSSGRMTLSEITGDCKLESFYGNQTISDLKGKLNISNRSGDININRHEGNLQVEATYGHVNLYDCKGRIAVQIRSGNLNGSHIQLVESLDIHSGYGNIKMQIDNSASELSFELDSPHGKISVKKDDIEISKENSSLVVSKGNIKIRSEASRGSQYFY